MQQRNSRRKLLAEMNVVPYIDVMLVLVVILMVAAPYVNPALVDLPSVRSAAKAPDKIIEVIVAPDGKLSIRSDGKVTPIEFPTLVSTVQEVQKQLEKPVPVVIAADKTVQYEKVIDVMKRLQEANINRIGLSLKLEGGSSK